MISTASDRPAAGSENLLRGVAAARALSERIATSRLATMALERWCCERGLADGQVSVRLVGAVPEPLDDEAVRALGGLDGVTYRQVQLVLGGLVIADASNWYLADRLTSEMRARLTTDCPFGEAIEALRPRRRTLGVHLAPAEAIERAVAVPEGDRPFHVLEHQALMHSPDGTPLAVVCERFRAVLVR